MFVWKREKAVPAREKHAIFKSSIACLEHVPLLGFHASSLSGTDRKEGCIKTIDIFVQKIPATEWHLIKT